MVTEDPDAQCTKKTGFNRARQKESTSRGHIPSNQMCIGTKSRGRGVVGKNTKLRSKARKSEIHLKNKIQKINNKQNNKHWEGEAQNKTQDLQNLDTNTGSRPDRINGVHENRNIETTTRQIKGLRKTLRNLN